MHTGCCTASKYHLCPFGGSCSACFRVRACCCCQIRRAQAKARSILGPCDLSSLALKAVQSWLHQYATGGYALLCLLAYRISKEPILSQVNASEFIDPLNPALRGVAQVWAAAQEQAKASQGAPPAEQQAKQQSAQPKQAKPCQQQEVSPTAQVTVTANSLRSPSGSGKRKLPAT